jgi:hypothetical protein
MLDLHDRFGAGKAPRWSTARAAVPILQRAESTPMLRLGRSVVHGFSVVHMGARAASGVALPQTVPQLTEVLMVPV